MHNVTVSQDNIIEARAALLLQPLGKSVSAHDADDVTVTVIAPVTKRKKKEAPPAWTQTQKGASTQEIATSTGASARQEIATSVGASAQYTTKSEGASTHEYSTHKCASTHEKTGTTMQHGSCKGSAAEYVTISMVNSE